jgi:phosphoribosylaminoimidazole-succinocarboxamide synthase
MKTISLTSHISADVNENIYYSKLTNHSCYIDFLSNFNTQISSWWYQKIKTEKLFDTHFIKSKDNVLFVKNTKKVHPDIAVFGYMVGEIWHDFHQKGIFVVNGFNIKKYKFGDKFTKPIYIVREVAPNIKQIEINYISSIAQLLFNIGNTELEKRGIQIISTNYSFGVYNNSIILTGNIHVPSNTLFKFSTEKGIDLDFDNWCMDNITTNDVPQHIVTIIRKKLVLFYTKLFGVNLSEFIHHNPERKNIELLATSQFHSCSFVFDTNIRHELSHIVNGLSPEIVYYSCFIDEIGEISNLEKNVVLFITNNPEHLGNIKQCSIKSPTLVCLSDIGDNIMDLLQIFYTIKTSDFFICNILSNNIALIINKILLDK